MLKNIVFIFLLSSFYRCASSQNCDTSYQDIQKNIVAILYHIDTLDKKIWKTNDECYIKDIIDSSYFYREFVKSDIPNQCEIGVRVFHDFYCTTSFNCNYQKEEIYTYLRDNYFKETNCNLNINNTIAKSIKYENCYLNFKSHFFNKNYLYGGKLYLGILIVEIENSNSPPEIPKYKLKYQCLIPLKQDGQ